MNTLQILFVLAAAVLTVDAACNETSFNACTKNFTDKYPNAGDFSDYPSDKIDEICMDYKKTSDCINPIIGDCPPLISEVWKGIDRIVKFMCSDESRKFIKDNAECLDDKEDEIEKGIEDCTNDNPVDPNKSADEQCSALKKLVSCSVGAAKDQCGSDVEDWFKKYIDVSFEGLTNITKCDITDGSGMNQYSFVFLALSVILGFVIQK